MDEKKLKEFSDALQALLDKYGYFLKAIPTYTPDKEGKWWPDAEIKVLLAPPTPPAPPEGSVPSTIMEKA